MKGSESLYPDRLEESLSCDDLFLQYFNAFLDLPAFPLRLRYDRLTGTFHELTKDGNSIAGTSQYRISSSKASTRLIDVTLPGSVHGLPGGPVYGVKDDEKERVLEWACKNRLPLFLQTRLHREFKLCKLLLRPLDYRRGSSRIRGYSRLSMGTTATSYTPNESPTPDNQSSLAWTDAQSIKNVSYGIGNLDSSRPNSRTLSLPPDLGGKTWSETAMYDTSATETSSTTEDEVVAWQRRNAKYRPRAKYRGRRNVIGPPSRTANGPRQNTNDHSGIMDDTRLISDSGLGTTAFDYSTTIGTSGKTRNMAGTRADTLGVGSRWESEAGYSTRTPDTRTHTAMTSSSLPAEGTQSPSLITGYRYEGKSALRTADSPSKPHRATIVVPQPGRADQLPIVEVSTGSRSFENTSSTPPKGGDVGGETLDINEDGFDDVSVEGDDGIIDDDDDVSGFLEFDDRDSSCDETETEIASIQKVHSMKLQHIKERLLGSKQGVDSLLGFLTDTAGINLVRFWLDAEAFKDALASSNEEDGDRIDASATINEDMDSDSSESVSTDEGVVIAWRHRLFREILDRHKFTLTQEASEQIREAQSNLGLTCHVFARTQYDALRRLRSYWLPRYIVHCSTRADFEKRLSTGMWDIDTSNGNKSSSFEHTFLPLLTIGHVVPTAQLLCKNSKAEDKIDLKVRPLESFNAEKAAALDRPTTAQIRVMSARSASNHLLLRALATEPNAGCPFRQYMKERAKSEARNAYDFWVTLEHSYSWSSNSPESKPTQTMSLLKSGNIAGDIQIDVMDAWKIFSNFLWPINAPRSIGIPTNMHNYARTLDHLLRRAINKVNGTNTNIPSTVFQPAKIHALFILSGSWKKYCKLETEEFFEAREGRPYSPVSVERPATPPRTTASKRGKQMDEMSVSLSETTTIFSKPWLTDDDTTETDSASTMYSYDVERIRQIAAIIRQRGGKKPQRTPRRPPPVRRRAVTANRGQSKSEAGKSKAGKDDAESVSSQASKKKQTKVQFNLPDHGDSRSTSHMDDSEGRENREKRDDQENGEAGDDEGADSGEEEKKKKIKRKKSLLHQHPNKMNYQELKDNKLYTYFRRYVAQCESMEVQNVFQMYALCDALRSVSMTELDRRSALANELSRTYLSSSGPKQIAMSSELSSPFVRELPNPSVEVTEALQSYVMPTLNQAAANFSIGFSAALKEYKLDIRSDLSTNATKAELALRTLTLKPSSKRRRALGKHSARQPPTTDHKQTFMDALNRAAEGDLPIDLLHFYKYLQGFGGQEGFPMIHNDLMFYVEVMKFLACFHDEHDLVTLKRKVKSILQSYITSGMEPPLQIDIKTGTAERLRRAADSFINDKGRDPYSPNLFDDAQHTVFNELLPFWAGFASARPLSERDEKRPVLKSERLQRRRLEAFLKTPEPKREFVIPKSTPKFDMHGLEFTFSVNGGIQWKEWSEVSSSRSSSPPPEGIIEIVKMPPKGQSRRIIRRGNFSIKKLQVIKEKPTLPSVDRKRDAKTGNARKASATNRRTEVINYTTSVS